jgi:hypothetical protein
VRAAWNPHISRIFCQFPRNARSLCHPPFFPPPPPNPQHFMLHTFDTAVCTICLNIRPRILPIKCINAFRTFLKKTRSFPSITYTIRPSSWRHSVYDAKYKFCFSYRIIWTDRMLQTFRRLSVLCIRNAQTLPTIFYDDIRYTMIISELRHQTRAEMHAYRSSCRMVVKNVR